MKKIALAVLVAAFGYNCAMAQGPGGRVINSKQGPVVKAPRSSENQTVSNTARPAVKNPHIKPYTGKKNIKGVHGNVAKQKPLKPAPRPGKGKHLGNGHKHHGNGKGLGHVKHGCQKPPQLQVNNNINRPQSAQPQQNNSMQRPPVQQRPVEKGPSQPINNDRR